MRISSFGYLIRDGLRNIYVNRLMSFASIGTLMACMLLIGASMLFSMNVNQIVGYVEQKNEVVVFLKDDITEEELADVKKSIGMIDNVNIEESVYMTKEEVLEEQKALLGESAGLLEGLEGTENPLPPTYKLKIRDVSSTASTEMQLNDIPGIIGVKVSTEAADILTSIKHAVSVSGMFIVILLVAVSLVIIANTIKVTVFNRRREISIMKYVGATDSFIRLPFFVEGFFLGLISALVAFALLWGGYNYVIQTISSSAYVLQQAAAGGAESWLQQAYNNVLPFGDVALQLLAWFCGGGIGIGVFGSMFFVSRYLKV